MRSLYFLPFLILLASCQATTNFAEYSPLSQSGTNYAGELDRLDPAARQNKETLLRSPKALREYLAGSTLKTFGEHGVQISFHAKDGTVWLAYPGNNRPIKGKWKTNAIGQFSGVCYFYGPNSVNPLTGRSQSDFLCQKAWNHVMPRTTEVVSGDIFNLQKRTTLPSRSSLMQDRSVSALRSVF